MIWLLANGSMRVICETAHAFRDRNGTQIASNGFAKILAKKLDVSEQAEKKAAVFVWGEPAVVFGLRANHVAYAIPAQGLRPRQLPASLRSFVVFGKQAAESKEFAETREVMKDFDFCKIERLSASHLVSMDSFHGTRNEFDQFRILPRRPDDDRFVRIFHPFLEMWMYEILR